MTRTDYVMNDMSKSNAAMKLYEPLLCKLLNCEHIKAVEGVDNEICKILDLSCGIDYLKVECKNGGPKGIANRVQWIEPTEDYNTFTIRKTRESGAATEFAKRLESIENGSLYPDLTMHTYIDKNMGEIRSLAIARTKDVIKYILKYNPPTRFARDESGWAEFYYCDWDDMADKGYELLRYDAVFGSEHYYSFIQLPNKEM